MTPEQQSQLSAPFKPEQIGKLPKPTKKENPKGRCAECGGYHGLPAMHLDFVGHAIVTARLLDVDPAYEFGPVLDINRRPIKSEDGSVLYSLTVGGVTRYEWGDGPNMKEISSDAIRRCAMRFGVALDLWAKEPLHAAEDVEPAVAPKKARRAKGSASPTPAAAELPASQRVIMAFAQRNSIDDETRHRITRRIAGVTSSKDVPPEMIDKVVVGLKWYVDFPAESLRKIEAWERDNGMEAA